MTNTNVFFFYYKGNRGDVSHLYKLQINLRDNVYTTFPHCETAQKWDLYRLDGDDHVYTIRYIKEV